MRRGGLEGGLRPLRGVRGSAPDGTVPFDATPLLRAATSLRLRQVERLHPATTQAALLHRLLRRAAGTRFGAAHGFAAIRDVADYQARVPLRRYEAFWRDWWQPGYPRLDNVTWPGRVPYLALSSGTTSGTTKYIPVTRRDGAANRRAGLDTLAWHMRPIRAQAAFGGCPSCSAAPPRCSTSRRACGRRPVRHRRGMRCPACSAAGPGRRGPRADRRTGRQARALAERAPRRRCGFAGHAVLAAGAAATAGARRDAAPPGPRTAGAWRRRLGALSRAPRALPAPGLRDARGLPGQSEDFIAGLPGPRRGRRDAPAAGPRLFLGIRPRGRTGAGNPRATGSATIGPASTMPSS